MWRTVAVRGLVVVFATAAGSGCAGADVQPAATVVRDSAGVMIVENVRPTWGAGDGWRISSEPLVRIGLTDGPPEYRLYHAYSAVRLADGRIVVANGGTNELRFYDAAGTHLFSVGRTGDGPGEFRDLQRVWALPGDSLLAYDFFPARLSVFGPGGEFARSLRVISPEGRQVLVRGHFSDGSLIAAGAPIWAAAGATTGVVWDSVPYYHYDAGGALIATLGPFPFVEVFRTVTADGWSMTSLPFPRAPVTAVAGDRVYFGPADTYELQVYTGAGELERLIRLTHANRPVTPDDVARFRRERLEAAEREGTRPRMERALRAMPYPETMPPYERLRVDAEGNLWVADYTASAEEAQSWRVFSPEGEYLGDVAVPARLEVFQIGADFVLGRWLDDLEVEHIRVYRLVKS